MKNENVAVIEPTVVTTRAALEAALCSVSPGESDVIEWHHAAGITTYHIGGKYTEDAHLLSNRNARVRAAVKKIPRGMK